MDRITENELETYIADEPGCLFGTDKSLLLGRQVAVPHGRIDLLIFHTYLYIVELKVRPLQEKDVCQVLRYMRDVKDLIYFHGHLNALYNHYLFHRKNLTKKDQVFFEKKFLEFEDMEIETIDERCIRPILVGPREQTKHIEDIASAMYAVKGAVLQYTMPSPNYFEFYETIGDIHILNPEYAIGTLDWFHIFAHFQQFTTFPNSNEHIDVLPWEGFHDALYKRNRG